MRWLVILSYLATVVVNGLANALPINGVTTGEISNRFEVLFTPAGYVFAIWGLIYLGLGVFSVVQALPSQRENPRLGRARIWLALTGPANIAWLLAWHYQRFSLSLVAMISLLGLLVLTYLALQVGRQSVSTVERWLIQAPVGIYLGWISVATIANVSVLLEIGGWDGAGLGPTTWTVVMIAVALVVGAAVVGWRRDVTVPLVLVWAFAGIAVRHAGLPLLAPAAWLAAVGAAGLAVAAILRSRRLGASA